MQRPQKKSKERSSSHVIFDIKKTFHHALEFEVNEHQVEAQILWLEIVTFFDNNKSLLNGDNQEYKIIYANAQYGLGIYAYSLYKDRITSDDQHELETLNEIYMRFFNAAFYGIPEAYFWVSDVLINKKHCLLNDAEKLKKCDEMIKINLINLALQFSQFKCKLELLSIEQSYHFLQLLLLTETKNQTELNAIEFTRWHILAGIYTKCHDYDFGNCAYMIGICIYESHIKKGTLKFEEGQVILFFSSYLYGCKNALSTLIGYLKKCTDIPAMDIIIEKLGELDSIDNQSIYEEANILLANEIIHLFNRYFEKDSFKYELIKALITQPYHRVNGFEYNPNALRTAKAMLNEMQGDDGESKEFKKIADSIDDEARENILSACENFNALKTSTQKLKFLAELSNDLHSRLLPQDQSLLLTSFRQLALAYYERYFIDQNKKPKYLDFAISYLKTAVTLGMDEDEANYLSAKIGKEKLNINKGSTKEEELKEQLNIVLMNIARTSLKQKKKSRYEASLAIQDKLDLAKMIIEEANEMTDEVASILLKQAAYQLLVNIHPIEISHSNGMTEYQIATLLESVSPNDLYFHIIKFYLVSAFLGQEKAIDKLMDYLDQYSKQDSHVKILAGKLASLKSLLTDSSDIYTLSEAVELICDQIKIGIVKNKNDSRGLMTSHYIKLVFIQSLITQPFLKDRDNGYDVSSLKMAESYFKDFSLIKLNDEELIRRRNSIVELLKEYTKKYSQQFKECQLLPCQKKEMASVKKEIVVPDVKKKVSSKRSRRKKSSGAKSGKTNHPIYGHLKKKPVRQELDARPIDEENEIDRAKLESTFNADEDNMAPTPVLTGLPETILPFEINSISDFVFTEESCEKEAQKEISTASEVTEDIVKEKKEDEADDKKEKEKDKNDGLDISSCETESQTMSLSISDSIVVHQITPQPVYNPYVGILTVQMSPIVENILAEISKEGIAFIVGGESRRLIELELGIYQQTPSKQDVDIVVFQTLPPEHITEITYNGYVFTRTKDPHLFKNKELNIDIYFSKYATPEEDMQNRDFTVNTLCIDAHKKIYDFLGSALRHLKMRRLYTILNYHQSFYIDPRRMLRAVDLLTQGYKWGLQSWHLSKLIKYLNDREKMPAEQQNQRLCKHFMNGKAWPSLYILLYYGFFQQMMPGIDENNTHWLMNKMYDTDVVYYLNLSQQRNTPLSKAYIFTVILLARLKSDKQNGKLMCDEPLNDYLIRVMNEFNYPNELCDAILGIPNEKHPTVNLSHLKMLSSEWDRQIGMVQISQPIQRLQTATMPARTILQPAATAQTSTYYQGRNPHSLWQGRSHSNRGTQQSSRRNKTTGRPEVYKKDI